MYVNERENAAAAATQVGRTAINHGSGLMSVNDQSVAAYNVNI